MFRKHTHRTTLKEGSKVTFHYWSGGALHSAPATVKAVLEADDAPQALDLEVDFPEELMEREGFVRRQSHSRMRTVVEDDVHASGSWSPPSPA